MIVYDAIGKAMDSTIVVMRKGINTVELDVSQYAAGIYFVMIRTTSGTITARFVKN